MAEREQTLADFQACTGLDDVEICITILEQHDWNLMAAVQRLMPDDHEGTSAAENVTPQISHLPDLTGASTLPSPGASLAAGASTSLTFSSGSRPLCSRMLHFSVEYRDKTISVVLPDTETVGKIKEIFSRDLSIPMEEMQLCGFRTKKIEDSRILRDLELPAKNKLYILTPNLAVTVATRAMPVTDNTDQTYKLNITFRDSNQLRQFNLQFLGSNSVRDVKVAVETITHVPVMSQDWSGWPGKVSHDEMLLCETGIAYPNHKLTVTRLQCSRHTSPPSPSPIVEIESGSEEDEDMVESFPDDDIFVSDDAEVARNTTLLPPDVGDEVAGLEHFTSQFYERYGDSHPVFYVGSLDDAIRDSLLVKARERKPLAIYLHHDASILANVFCSQILCSDSIVNYLSENFMLWGWDLTHESNKNRWLSLASQHFGTIPSAQLRSVGIDQLPTLLILMRSRGSNEVFTVIPGSSTLDEVMTALMNAVEMFHQQLSGDITEEDERNQREMIKQEQDEAYEQSLRADRAKVKAVQEQQYLLKQEEEKRHEEEQVKEAIMKSLAMSLPDEPGPQCTEPVSQFRIRTPTGETISRRFRASETLDVLLKYITSTGHDTTQYKVLRSYPRRDITDLDQSQSLKTLLLFPQETLILEER